MRRLVGTCLVFATAVACVKHGTHSRATGGGSVHSKDATHFLELASYRQMNELCSDPTQLETVRTLYRSQTGSDLGQLSGMRLGEERQAWLTDAKKKLKSSIITKALIQSLRYRNGFLPYSSLFESTGQQVQRLATPLQCAAHPKEWKQARQALVSESLALEHFADLDSWNEGHSELVVFAALKATFIEKILLSPRWASQDFSLGLFKVPKIGKETAFYAQLPLYPGLDFGEDAIENPAHELLQWYARFPLLRRPGKWGPLGYPTQSIAESITQRYLQKSSGKKAAAHQALSEIVVPRFQTLFREWLSKPQGAAVKNVHQQNPARVLAVFWYQFIRHELDNLLVEAVVTHPLSGEKLTTWLAGQLAPSHDEWVLELDKQHNNMCSAQEPDFLFKSFTLVLSTLEDMKEEERSRGLDAYCHGGWGKTFQKFAVDGAELLSSGFLLSSLVAPGQAHWMAPVAAGLTLAQFGVRAGREWSRTAMMSALFNPSLLERQRDFRGTRTLAAAGPFTAAVSVAAGIISQIVGGVPLNPFHGSTQKAIFSGTYFGMDQALTIQKFRDKGINPIGDPMYYKSLALGAAHALLFGNIATAHTLKGVVAGEATAMYVTQVINHLSQSLFSAVSNNPITFEANSASYYIWRNLSQDPVEHTAVNFFKNGLRFLEGISPELHGVALAATTIVYKYLHTLLHNEDFIKTVYGNKSFPDALRENLNASTFVSGARAGDQRSRKEWQPSEAQVRAALQILELEPFRSDAGLVRLHEIKKSVLQFYFQNKR